MNAKTYLSEDSALAQSPTSKKNYRFSFTSFQKAIRANSELRTRVEDIIDMGLFDYALRRNTDFIQSVREKAEAEAIEIMMHFAHGVEDYQVLKRSIHRNRIIRTLAIMDRKAQLELAKKFNISRKGD
jgi:hypothetical protein